MSCVGAFQGAITNILEENVVQPLLVSTSAIHLAAETVRSILKIDDIVCSLPFFLPHILQLSWNSYDFLMNKFSFNLNLSLVASWK